MTAALADIAPTVTLFATALLVLTVDVLLPRSDVRPPAILSVAGLVAALLLAVRQWSIAVGAPGATGVGSGGMGLSGSTAASAGMVAADGFGLFVTVLLVLWALLVALLTIGFAGRHEHARAEMFVLLLLATAAMTLFVLANDLVLLFLCLETFSIALYSLCAVRHRDRYGQEAALKYFVLGAVAGSFTLYGIALLYATTGSTQIDAIGRYVAAYTGEVPTTMYAGLALLLVGLGFKVAVAPFHQWTPDVYQGAPVTVTAFMAAATKTAAFAVMLRVLWTAFPGLEQSWVTALGAIAVLTIVVGNLTALVQSDMKRMLAYSAIAHAGYLLVAVIVGTPEALTAALFYLLVYAAMNIGAFSVLSAMRPESWAGGDEREPVQLDDLRGLARRHVGLAAAMALYLFSLAGLPPTGGFLAKWYLYDAAIADGFALLALAIALGSLVSAFYYLRPVAYMFMAEPQVDDEISVSMPEAVVVATTAAIVAFALLLAAPLVDAARASGTVGAIEAAEAPAVSDDAPPPMYFSPPEFEKGRKTRP
ncbi:MAG: NADH-quinone oxidoreductase subunit N [Anaerolineae bacterium]